MTPGSSSADPRLVLPNFLIIGMQRSGTRWLRTNLDQHPDVFMPSFELSYFTKAKRQNRPGRKWYSGQFEAWDGEPFIGECSPAYLMPSSSAPVVADRITTLIPEARLIMILRAPVDRMYSAMVHHIKRGRLPADSDLFEMVRTNDPALAELDLIEASLYYKHIPWWIDHFGDQLLLLDQDDIRNRPGEVYQQALTHIGARTDFVPRDLETVVFSNRNSVRATRLTDEQRRILYHELFRVDIEEFEAWLGRTFPGWDPGPQPLLPLSEIAPARRTKADEAAPDSADGLDSELVEEPDSV
jgi:hypothetical protein